MHEQLPEQFTWYRRDRKEAACLDEQFLEQLAVL